MVAPLVAVLTISMMPTSSIPSMPIFEICKWSWVMSILLVFWSQDYKFLIMLNNKSTQSIYKLSTFAVGVASFEIASIVSNVCQFVPKPQQRILQFDTHLPHVWFWNSHSGPNPSPKNLPQSENEDVFVIDFYDFFRLFLILFDFLIFVSPSQLFWFENTPTILLISLEIQLPYYAYLVQLMFIRNLTLVPYATVFMY